MLFMFKIRGEVIFEDALREISLFAPKLIFCALLESEVTPSRTDAGVFDISKQSDALINDLKECLLANELVERW